MKQRSVILTAFLLTPLVAASPVGPKLPTFFARRDYTGLNSEWVQVADTNGDGIPDLIADGEGDIQILFGNGDGTFRTWSQLSYGGDRLRCRRGRHERRRQH
jgi:hypothetical protein